MKNILHIIESLDTGGAELLLVKTLPKLKPGFNHTVAYLKKPETLLPELKDFDVIYLNYKGRLSFPAVVMQLRKIIREKKINIVHSHLFLPTILARFACPTHVKLIFHVHSILSEDAFKHNALARTAEKLTYNASQTAIFVSDTVKQDYDAFIGIDGPYYVLYNFADDIFFKAGQQNTSSDQWHQPVKMVSVGNLKTQKNFQFLLQAFEHLKDFPVSLDIYGEGPLRPALEQELKQKDISNINLKGYHSGIAALLPDYDVLIMASENEGFCISVAEAMAAGLPCLLSDIKTFREITANNAVFFNPEKAKDLVLKIKAFSQLKPKMNENAEKAKNRSELYKLDVFIEKLTDIYNSLT